MNPAKALADMDSVVMQAQMNRNQHAHMVNCRIAIEDALKELGELKQALAEKPQAVKE